MKESNFTVTGWVLFASIIALGGSLFAGEIFKGEKPEKPGYPIEGVEAEGGEGAAVAEKPIAFYLASSDAAKGAEVFKKCQACHNAEPGGANGLGPNLYHVLGEGVGQGRGFAWSPVLSAHGGKWDWETLSTWLANPKKFAPGTKMTFAGLSNPVDRANVIAYLNSKGPAPLPMPAAPAETAAAGATAAPGAAADKAAAEADDAGAQKAKDVPTMTEQQATKSPAATIGGEGASKLTGPEPTVKK